MPLSAHRDRQCRAAGARAARAAPPGGSSFRRYLSALPIRFWSSWRICSGSASITGSAPTSIRPPPSAMTDSRSAITSRAIAGEVGRDERLGSRGDLRVREQVVDQGAHAARPRPACARGAGERRLRSAGPAVAFSRSPNVRILRSGSCRSCDATDANSSSAAFERCSSERCSARRHSVKRRSVMSSIASRMMRGVFGPVRHEPRVQQHDLAADAGKHVVDLEIVEARLDGELVAQQLAERRDVPLAVAEREQHLADGVLAASTRKTRKNARFACVTRNSGSSTSSGSRMVSMMSSRSCSATGTSCARSSGCVMALAFVWCHRALRRPNAIRTCRSLQGTIGSARTVAPWPAAAQ